LTAPLGGYPLPPGLRPSAYFPLTNGSLAAWPGGLYQGSSSGPVTWVADDTFGSVLYCRKGGRASVRVCPLPPQLAGWAVLYYGPAGAASSTAAAA
jgi:hypothetical protein